jgi:hypothetical protein
VHSLLSFIISPNAPSALNFYLSSALKNGVFAYFGQRRGGPSNAPKPLGFCLSFASVPTGIAKLQGGAQVEGAAKFYV